MASRGRLVSVVNLGRMGYMTAYKTQMQYARRHLDHLANKSKMKGKNVLLIMEHDPVYTVGIRDKNYDEKEEEKLKKLGAEFHRTNRGGLITYHGPGQLVAYPIINLKDFEPSMKWYVSALEKTMIETCGYYNISARTTEDTGVWVGEKKIGAIGIHGSRYITTHGISLNCNTDLSWFDHIVPCGLEGKESTSITKELQQEVSINDIILPFIKAFKKQFECKIESTMLDATELDAVNSDENGNNSEQHQQKVAHRPMW